MIDYAVVGAGIVGLATARSLLLRHPGCSVIVFDKEREVGVHQTGHNSGVIHSGVSCPPGTEKAALCVEGSRLMLELCAEHDIAVRRRGKLIVAIEESELDALAVIERNAADNGVSGVRRLDAAGIAEIEPAATGIAALHIPATAVVDFRQVARALSAEVTSAGGSIVLSSEVDSVKSRKDGTALVEFSDRGSERAKKAVVCAGLQSDRLAARSETTRRDLRIVPFRGSYYTLAPRAAALVRSLIYPVPDARFPFLGVHFTRHVNDVVSCGPNAVLALSRERYRRGALRPRDLWDTVRFAGTWRLARDYWSVALQEVALDVSKSRYLQAARRYLPDLGEKDLTPGQTGVRAQAVDSRGSLIDDFVFEADGPVLHVRNAPSPAATASLAIGERLVDRLDG